VTVVYDLSATPFFLRGSGYREGELFGWVVSDFSLMDAIEAGIVKIPRVPTHDDVVARDEPIFRHVYKYVRDQLPKKGPKKADRNEVRRAAGDLGGCAAGTLPRLRKNF
jgi:type III restriction enzyme